MNGPKINLSSKELKAHLPPLKRAGKMNKGVSHRYGGTGHMIGFRNAYHHGADHYVHLACNKGCGAEPGGSCRYVELSYKLGSRVSEHAHVLMSQEQAGIKAHLKSEVEQRKILDPDNVVVAAMLTSRESPIAKYLIIFVLLSCCLHPFMYFPCILSLPSSSSSSRLTSS